MIREAIFSLSNQESLSYDTAKEVMDEIMSGDTSQIQMSAYLTALAMKGETIDEITGSAKGMREHCIRLLHDMDVLEIVERAEIVRIHLIFPQPQRLSYRPEAFRWQSTATARRLAGAVRRTSWKLLV